MTTDVLVCCCIDLRSRLSGEHCKFKLIWFCDCVYFVGSDSYIVLLWERKETCIHIIVLVGVDIIRGFPIQIQGFTLVWLK